MHRAGPPGVWTRPSWGARFELATLQKAFEGAVERGEPSVITIVGEVGVGKSRLALEFLRWARDHATVLQGRCPSYGEGSTFWPLAEVLHQAAGVAAGEAAPSARGKIARLLERHADAPMLTAKISQAIGLTEGRAASVDAFRALGTLFSELARKEPVVVLFDDIQWAEPTFLEFLRHLIAAGEGPVFVVCAARTELMERHPDWLADERVGAALPLRRLPDEHCGRLVDYVLGRDAAGNVRGVVVAAAEGNPLFLEELLAMLIDEGLLVDEQGRYVLEIDPAGIRVPPTIQALLEARLDRLGDAARATIEAGAVVGEWFDRREIVDLLPPELAQMVDEAVAALIDKELLEHEEGAPRGESAYRFHHTLIRDVAYEAMPKQLRAELHERHADWLEETARGWSRRLQEIVGHHLERAYRYRLELGQHDERATELARRAGEQLSSAGHKAMMRKDFPAAAGLLERAADLMAENDPKRLDLLPMLGEAYAEKGRLDDAYRVLDEAIEGARHAGRRAVESHALMVLLKLPARPGFTLSLGYGLGSDEGYRRSR